MNGSNKPIKVLIADDTVIARSGLARILESEDGIAVIGEAATAQEVPLKVRQLRPDVALIDLKWGADETAGTTVIEQIKKESTDTQIIAITVFQNRIPAARKAGADGVLSKGFAVKDLMDMIRAVHANRSFPRPHVEAMTDGLSDREMEVLVLIDQGKTDKEIAAALNISVNTARNHVASVLGKLGANNRTQASRIAREKGLIA